MFNNCDSKTNGESKFFTHIKDNIHFIFGVGCRVDSEFINFSDEVHYFDSVKDFIENLKNQPNLNKKSYFNYSGLGEENKGSYYYPKYQPFHDRINSCHIRNDADKILSTIKKEKDYMVNNQINNINFLKVVV